MFVRKYIKRRANGTVGTSLGIARTYRRGKKVYQQHLCHLGSLDQLREKGEIDKLIQGLSQFSQRQWVIADKMASQPVPKK